MNLEPIQVNGISIYPFKDYNQLIELISEKKGILVAVNAEKILYANYETRTIINNNIGYSDGIGAVWALKQKGQSSKKMPGVEVWLRIVEKYHDSKSFYVVGGKKKVIELTVTKLKAEFSKINILGYRDGYLKTDDEEKLIIDIEKKKPDIVFVAIGSPKQELLMSKMQKVHSAIYQGLGGSFDVYTGTVKRAPVFWTKNGMEWFYRWMSDPLKRTNRIINLTKFYWKLKTNQF